MRYILVLAYLLLAWLLIDEFVLKDRSREGLDTFRDKWKDLGSRLHMVFGILALLMMAFLAVRFVFGAIDWP
ncbi:hypothetical protein ACFL2Q_12465 [Thermodesulfobacteriota bacterium]